MTNARPISIKGAFSVTNSLGAFVFTLGMPTIANKERTPNKHPRMNHPAESLFFSLATQAQKQAATKFNSNNHSIQLTDLSAFPELVAIAC